MSVQLTPEQDKEAARYVTKLREEAYLSKKLRWFYLVLAIVVLAWACFGFPSFWYPRPHVTYEDLNVSPQISLADKVAIETYVQNRAEIAQNLTDLVYGGWVRGLMIPLVFIVMSHLWNQHKRSLFFAMMLQKLREASATTTDKP